MECGNCSPATGFIAGSPGYFRVKSPLSVHWSLPNGDQPPPWAIAIGELLPDRPRILRQQDLRQEAQEVAGRGVGPVDPGSLAGEDRPGDHWNLPVQVMSGLGSPRGACVGCRR